MSIFLKLYILHRSLILKVVIIFHVQKSIFLFDKNVTYIKVKEIFWDLLCYWISKYFYDQVLYVGYFIIGI